MTGAALATTQSAEERVLLADVEVERTLLFQLIERPEEIGAVGALFADDFSDPRHGAILEAIRRLGPSAGDFTILREHLLRNGAGPAADLVNVVVRDVVTSGLVAPLAQRVREGSVRRELSRRFGRLALEAAEARRPVSDVIDEVDRATERARRVISPASSPIERDSWPPPPDRAAFAGLLGEAVDLYREKTEADEVAILAQLLAGIGNLLGREPRVRVGEDVHRGNLFAVLVGETARARKGTSWGIVRAVLDPVDPAWMKDRVLSGFGSGEGVITALADEEPDRRALVLEPEFGRVLIVAAREGSTLGTLLRDGWDGRDLANRLKKETIIARDPHLGIVGHITLSELHKRLDEDMQQNGLANRVLWFAVRRPRLEPFPGRPDSTRKETVVRGIREAIDRARGVGEIAFSPATRGAWREVYPDLGADRGNGPFGAATTRAEAQVIRLSLIFAAVDSSRAIEPAHLESALAVWSYAESSARYIFGESTGDEVADRIDEALRQTPNGMTSTDISSLFQRHQHRSRIGRALDLLQRTGRARRAEPTRTSTGRPPEIWVSTTTNGAKEAKEVSPDGVSSLLSRCPGEEIRS